MHFAYHASIGRFDGVRLCSVHRKLARSEAMSNVTMTNDRKIALPPELCAKHGFTTGTPIRIVETRTGLLLIPLTKTPMTPELTREVAEWQELSLSSWELF